MRALFWRVWLLLTTLCLAGVSTRVPAAEPVPARPNILWISLEDISPDLGCYGDKYATTPVLDKFATESVRYTRCFTHAGVCAPSRSGLITGMYPPSITTQHMRCDGVPPPYVRCFPEYLRAAGYYCTNNSKTDYQFTPPITAWDENGNEAHWKNRGKDAAGKDHPFFAVFNLVTTHESQIRTPGAIGRKLPAAKKHDPAKATLPPYYPDTPVVRQDWANYYDNLTATEVRIAELLQELDDAGLHDETIVWFWGDHGRGLPRGKRWLYDSGVQVPLMIRVPEKWRKLAAPREGFPVLPGSVDDELHAFVDFAPTMLSLCGLEIPEHLQGQAFLGPKAAAKPREYVYGHRDRMDERYDLIRMVRDKRYKYLRNFRPDLPYAQHINYMDEMPTMQEWRRLAAEGKLNDQQKIFFTPYKPLEELYDTENDPHELVNLAAKPEQAVRLKALRAECIDRMVRINDTGLIPESVIEEVNHPDGKKPGMPRPNLTVMERDDKYLVQLLVPNGGAVAYQVQRVGARASAKSEWKTSVEETPITLANGDRLKAVGTRLGYRNSEPLDWTAGEAVPDSIFVKEAVGIEELRKLNAACFPKSYLQQQAEFLSPVTPLQKQERKESMLMLYIRAAAGAKAPLEERALRSQFFSDLSYLELAYSLDVLAALDKAEEAKKFAAALEETTNEYAQLDAALGLDRLGDLARPHLSAIQAAAKKDDYAGRVCQFIVKKLKKE